MSQQTREIECVGGGPNDGKVLTVGPEQGLYPCLLTVDRDGQSHYYVAAPRDGEVKFVHAGADMSKVISLIEETDPAAAAELVAQLAEEDDARD